MTAQHFNFSDKMDGLRQNYLAQLRERRVEIAVFYTHSTVGQVSTEEHQAILSRAHKMAGSGTTYGYPSITEKARLLEEALREKSHESVLAQRAAGLLAACDDALAQTPAAVPATAALPAATVSAEVTKPVMLVADDDSAILSMMRYLFRDEADIITATNGKEALDLIRLRKPALVMLDDNMPELSGMQVLETLREFPELAASQVIMLTANARTQDVMRALTAGAIDYITKPFEPEQITGRVRQMLRRLATTILVADDDATIRDLLAHKFRLLGFRVIESDDGEHTLKLVTKHLPQLVILDRMMPGLDGFAVLQMLRENAATRDIPALFLTARRNEKDILQGLRAGAADYITKPFIPEEVVARAMRLLGQNEKRLS